MALAMITSIIAEMRSVPSIESRKRFQVRSR
jgi:hypothetical protein